MSAVRKLSRAKQQTNIKITMRRIAVDQNTSMQDMKQRLKKIKKQRTRQEETLHG